MTTILKTSNFDEDALKRGQETARKNRDERMAQGLSANPNPIERAAERPESLRRAVTAKCYECVGMGGDANFRKSIRMCTSYTCPLYAVRPYQKSTENHELEIDVPI